MCHRLQVKTGKNEVLIILIKKLFLYIGDVYKKYCYYQNYFSDFSKNSLYKMLILKIT